MDINNTLYNFLDSTASKAVTIQNPNGSFPAGNNGPHDDPETPVRNTSHYLILLSKLYDKTSDESYRIAAEQAVDYLLSTEARPHGYTFHHRSSPKDNCNGIIGQAWTIEALAEAAAILGNSELVNVAEEVFLLHPFDERLGLWKRVEVDGNILCFDSTLNHQLWFAASGALIQEYHNVNDEIDRQVRRFLDKAKTLTKVEDSGLVTGMKLPIKEYPYATLADNWGRITLAQIALRVPFFESRKVNEFILKLTPLSRLPSPRSERRLNSIGYHSFHLYGFGLLRECYPNHHLWDESIFDAMWSYANSNQFLEELKQSPMGYPYNISGIEMAYATQAFDRGSKPEQASWLNRQFAATWEEKEQRLSRNTPDPITLTARLYEAMRLQDLSIEISVEDKIDIN